MVNAPIGVFDSGVGGLSVLKEIHRLLPQESLLYVADSGFAPYGDKSCDYIQQRCEQITRFFLVHSVKSIVVACNTATSVAVDGLRQWCPVPIIAMEPAIKPARLQTKSGVVGVLATTQTLFSANVNRLIAEHGKDIQVLLQPCKGFVELVESGQLQGEAVTELVRQRVLPLLAQGADTLVLGCTHYPFLSQVIRAVAGEEVTIIDPSAAIARQLQRKLAEHDGLAQGEAVGDIRFYTTGSVDLVQAIISQLWAGEVRVEALKAV